MSTIYLFDVHTHTQFAAFAEDQDAVIQRALDAGIWMVNVGTQRDTSASAVETAQKYPEGVYATVGLHPIHTGKSYHDEQELGIWKPRFQIGNGVSKRNNELGGFQSRGEEFDYDYYKKLAETPKVVAIGECGLDYYRLGEETKKKQQETFLRQIELAAELKKPLMIHCRNAFQDLIGILNAKSYTLNPVPGIIHFFTGTIEDARKLLNMGFSFSFGGVITFVPKSPKATGIPAAISGLGTRDYDDAVKYIPIERILLETDAPYVTPVPHRGKRNEPAYIMEVAKKMAELKNLPFKEICVTTKENALGIFGL